MKTPIQYRVKLDPSRTDPHYIIEKRPVIKVFGIVVCGGKWTFHDAVVSVEKAKQKISDHKALQYKHLNPTVVYVE